MQICADFHKREKKIILPLEFALGSCQNQHYNLMKSYWTPTYGRVTSPILVIYTNVTARWYSMYACVISKNRSAAEMR